MASRSLGCNLPGGSLDFVPRDNPDHWSPVGDHHSFLFDAVAVDETVDWSEIEPSPWTPTESAYGWDEIDALLGFLGELWGLRNALLVVGAAMLMSIVFAPVAAERKPEELDAGNSAS